MKSLLSLLIFTFIFTFSSEIFAQAVPKVTVKTNKKTYSPGETGVITISFKPAKNVKIPKEPDITVNLTEGVSGTGIQDYTGGAGEYLNSNFVKYNFTVPSNVTSGSTVKITGTVKFGYCNADDGICKIANKTFTTSIKIK